MLVPKLRFKREDGTDYPEWERSTIARHASFYNGDRGKNYPSTSDYVSNGVPFINAGDLEGLNISNKCAKISLEKYNQLSGAKLKPNDILYCLRGSLGKKGIVQFENGGTVASSLVAIRATDVNYKFLYYFLDSDLEYKQRILCDEGAAQPNLSAKNVGNFIISIPCLEEQQKIADFLSAVDEVIAQTEAEVQNLEQQKKAAMQKIFSQEVRFQREDGMEYPEWRYARTDEIAEINPKTSDLPNRFYYMDLGSVSKGAWQEKTITDKDNAPSRANRLASVGDVFFQSVRPYNMGHFFFEEEYEYPVVASTGFIQLRATQEYYNGFIYQLLYEDRFNAEVSIRCTGSNYPAINSENFSDIEMLFPCLEEQQKIADFLSAYDEAIRYAKQELDKWKELKKGLLQQMFV